MSKSKHDQELQQLLSQQNWKKVVQSCENYELEVLQNNLIHLTLVQAANETSNANSLPNYGIHLFAYLLLNDLYVP